MSEEDLYKQFVACFPSFDKEVDSYHMSDDDSLLIKMKNSNKFMFIFNKDYSCLQRVS